MATKDHSLSFNHNKKHESFGLNAAFNGQYSNLNLNNQNKQCFSENIVGSSKYGVTNESRKFDTNDSSQKKRGDFSRKKLIKDLPSDFFEQAFERRKELDYQEKSQNKNVSNSSTLSLHITAYENSIENTISDHDLMNDNKNALVKKNKEEIKKWKNKTNCFSDSTAKTVFELPRMQERAKYYKPEVMQFKASQQLRNPHQAHPSADLMNMIQRCQPRIGSRYNRVCFKMFKFGGLGYGKNMVTFLHVDISSDDDGVFVYFVPTPPNVKRTMFLRTLDSFFHEHEDSKGKEVLQMLLSKVDPINYVNLGNFQSFNFVGNFSTTMLDAFFTLRDNGNYSIIDAPTTILRGYFSRLMLRQYLPYIQSSNLMVMCRSGYQKLPYYKIIKEAGPHQTSFHFHRNVSQKFSKKKHFEKLRQVVLSNPFIECFSFSCSYKSFNFKELFKLVADPTFKINDKTINLCFVFNSRTRFTLYKRIVRKTAILNDILWDRCEFADCIRVKFLNAFNRRMRYILAPGNRFVY